MMDGKHAQEQLREIQKRQWRATLEGIRSPWWLPVGCAASILLVNLAMDALPSPWLAAPVGLLGVALVIGLATLAARRRRVEAHPPAYPRQLTRLLWAQAGVAVVALALVAVLKPSWLLAAIVVPMALMPVSEWLLVTWLRRRHP